MKKIGAAIVAVITALVVVTNIPEGVEPTTDIKQVTSGASVFNVESSGVDGLLVIVAGYAPAADRSISALTCDGLGMTKVAAGSLTGIRDIEIWTKTALASGTLAVTVTMTDNSDAEVSAVLLTDVDQTTPVAGQSVAVGQGIINTMVPKAGGNATLAVILSSPSDKTLTLPSGFTQIGNDVGGTDIRISAFMDDDASENQVALTFSGPTDFAAIIVGLNVAP